MWRQGDILIQEVGGIPAGAFVRRGLVLVTSEATGHRHEVQYAEGIRLFGAPGSLYLDVDAPRATIVHPEHGPIELPRGKYRIWRQREYDGARQWRTVLD